MLVRDYIESIDQFGGNCYGFLKDVEFFGNIFIWF